MNTRPTLNTIHSAQPDLPNNQSKRNIDVK